MSSISYALIAIAVVLAAVATTPLWVYVMSRPRVGFGREPMAWWSHLEPEEGQRRTMFIGIAVDFLNEGNEESNVSEVELEIGPDPYVLYKDNVTKVKGVEMTTYNPELMRRPAEGDYISRNGGRLQQKLVFSMPEPEPFQRQPHSQGLARRFYEDDDVYGVLTVRPGQNTRLLWGQTEIKAQLAIRWIEWGETSGWLRDSDAADAQSAPSGPEPLVDAAVVADAASAATTESQLTPSGAPPA